VRPEQRLKKMAEEKKLTPFVPGPLIFHLFAALKEAISADRPGDVIRFPVVDRIPSGIGQYESESSIIRQVCVV